MELELTSKKSPCRVEGWLNVWEIDAAIAVSLFEDGRSPVPIWEPHYCVAWQDDRKLIRYREEKDADERPGADDLPKTRLDGSKQQFDQRWGYEGIDAIKEQMFQYSPTPFASATSVDVYIKSNTIDGRSPSTPSSGESHTSYEKAVGGDREHRASVPAILAGQDSQDSNDGSIPGHSPASRLASFFSRKTFRSNLKRTKSVTKLDRKRSGSTLDNEAQSSKDQPVPPSGSLKRSFSLGRLARKNLNQNQATTAADKESEGKSQSPDNTDDTCSDFESVFSPFSPLWPPISSRMRSSRSHESLLINTQSTLHTTDLTQDDTAVRPLHHSLLNQKHCFQVETPQSHKYYSCRSACERQKWVQTVRQTMYPEADESHRVHNSLQLWVLESKNVVAKKRYFCELLLDKTLYARTSSKMKGDMLFWGEHFEFNNLPSVEIVTVNLYKEADKKKKKEKNVLIGYVNIPVTEIRNRQLVERWYPAQSAVVGKGKESRNDMPLVRIKAKYQSVHILPMVMYNDLIKYLLNDFPILVDVLEPLVSVKAKEDVATALVHVFQRLARVKHYISNIVMTEIDRLDNNHMIFRGNSIATKSIEAYMKLVGEKYLQDTLGEFVRTIIDSPDDCEVDPTRVATPQCLQKNQTNLIMYCEMAWCKIMNSYCYFPRELKEIFASFREKCLSRNRVETSENLISASIFLRFLCPAILSPSLFGLSQEYPNEKSARNLTLIAKTIQNLANFTKFGGKEEFMVFMNDFVEREWAPMKTFLEKISTNDPSNPDLLEFDGSIDLGKEISMLHGLLIETLDKVASMQPAEKRLARLTEILNALTEAQNSEEEATTDVVPEQRRNSSDGQYENVQQQREERSSSVTDSPAKDAKRMRKLMHDYKDAELSHVNDKCVMANLSRANQSCSLDGQDERISPGVSRIANINELKANEHKLNQSWNQMLRAAECVNEGCVDFISLTEDGQNSSVDLDSCSQLSLGGVSSSGYYSFGYSQSSSPIEAQVQDPPREAVHSPIPSQPLSFSNPMFRHHVATSSSPALTSSCRGRIRRHASSTSSDDDHVSGIPVSPINSKSFPRTAKPRELGIPRIINENNMSISEECLTTRPRHHRSASLMDRSPESPDSEFWYHRSVAPTASTQSADSRQPRYSQKLRRASMDPSHLRHGLKSDTNIPLSLTPPDSPNHHYLQHGPRRASLPHHMVRASRKAAEARRQAEAEKSKEQYEDEITMLARQLADSQAKLREAETRLKLTTTSQERLHRDLTSRMEETESLYRRRQQDKDEQMKQMIQRLADVEGDLRSEQSELLSAVTQKQSLIDAQERRIRSLNAANERLIAALSHVKDQYQMRNGLVASSALPLSLASKRGAYNDSG